MAFEGAQMVPVYDMNKSDGDGFMGGGAGWMWVVMLFFLLAWGEYASSADSNRNYCLSGLYPHR